MTAPGEIDEGVSVTALGTGASALDNGRASVGYVVRVDGDPALLVDAGGGTAARVSEARIDLTSLEAVFLGHLHVDHTADLPAIVKAAYQQGRGDRPLGMYGPAGNDDQPGTEAWMSKLFDPESGAYGYLPAFVERYADGDLALPTTEVDATVGDDPTRVYDRDGVTVDAMPVVHGRVPTLAYRVETDGASFTFTGDYAAETDGVARLADGTDVLVQHRLLEAGTDGPKTDLHPLPAEVGRIARDADVGTLALSHVGRDDPDALESSLEAVGEEFDGRIVVLDDLIDIYPDGTVRETRERPETGPNAGPSSRRRIEDLVFENGRSET